MEKRKNPKIKTIICGKCIKCGYNKCLDALDFHHLDPKEKSFNFRQGRGFSWDKLLEEAKKCKLVCANCHREIHACG